MKALILSLLACAAAIHAQDIPANLPASGPLPNLPDDTIVAVFDDGTALTMAQFRELANALPDQTRNREMFLRIYGMSRKLGKMAEQESLDKQSPWKEVLEYQRLMLLSQAETTTAMNKISVDSAAIAKYYDAHKDKYKEIKVKAIYIAFGGTTQPKGKKLLTEPQAKAKVEKLLAEIRGGADFVKLVKENSDDETSKEKDGDFPVIHAGDNIPDAMREAVFDLKQGEVSDPVRQANGYYLFRVEDVSYRPLDQVRDQVFMEVRNQQYADWLKSVAGGEVVKFPNAAFLGNAGAAPGSAPAPDGAAAAAAAAAARGKK
jgi:peptidyl-prolyl cis-trans isomerase C